MLPAMGFDMQRNPEFPPHLLRAQKLMALARSGAMEEALRLMEEFLWVHPVERSGASTKARLLKEAALGGPIPSEQQRLLGEAADWAELARICAINEGADWAYPAGQETFYRFLKGERPDELAGSVIEHVSSQLGADSFWSQTNLAEMHLVRREFDHAGDHYRRAAQLAHRAVGDLAANRSVAELFLAQWKEPSEVDIQEGMFI
jgi:hypothetical protein